MADGSELPAWLTFTGTHLEGTPPADFNGTLDLQLVASDGELSVTDGFALAITAVNDAPVLLGALDALTGTEDETFAFTLPYERFADIDGDPLAFTLSQADGSDVPAWLIFDAATGEVTGTPPADFNGSLDLVLTASDGEYSVNAPVRFTIDAVNDAPVLLVGLPDVVGTEDTALTFTIDTGTFGDVDGDALVLSATLVNGLALPEWLSFADGTFSAAPPQDYNGTLAITVSASDGEYSASDTFTLSFAAVNDPPVLQTPFIDLASDEDAPFDFTLDLGNFADVDGDTLTYSVLMADGSALPEWLQFEEGRLFGTPEQDFNGTLSLRITATDGEYIASDTFVLDILPVNDAPVLANWFAGTQHADEDAAIDIALPADAFTDVDGDALTLTAALANGEALPEWLAFDGTRFTGTPPQDFNGSFAIHVEATDGEYTASADFTLAIDPVNDAPVVLAPLGDVASAEDTAIDIAVPLDTFGDVDGDALTLTASLVGGAALPGWLTFDGTRLTGTPPQDFNGELDIEIMASDGALAVSDSFRLTVTPVNDAPVVLTPLADLVTAEDRAIDLPLPTSGFGDVDGDALTFSLTMADGSELPAWLSFDGARLTGTPPQDFNGVLSLTMTASDGELTVSDPFDLTILAVNDAPVVVTPLPNLSGTEDTAFVFAVDPASFADVDGDALTLSARLADGSGLPVWMRFDGTTLSGTPPQDFNGTLDIEVTANDGLLAASTVFTLAIDPVNDAPVLLAPLPDRTSAEDTAFSFTLPAGTFGDVDGDALTFTAALTGGDPLPGWLTFDGSVFAATPPQDFNGSLDITVTAGDGEYAAQGGFTLTVTPVNDAPVLIAGLSDRVFAEDTPVAFALETGKFADVDGDALSFTATLANGDPLPGWLAFDGTGFSGTPPQDYNGAFEVLVTASDGEYTVSDAFQLTIAPVNDAPVAAGTLADVTIYGRQTIDWQVPAGTFTDVDGDTLVLSATLADGSALPSWVSFDGTGFTGTVVDDFDGVVSFLVTASDGEYTATTGFDVTIIDPNDPPVAVDDGVFVGTQAQDLVILRADLLANDSDPDGDAIDIVSIGGAGVGSVSFDADGNIVYTVDSTFTGTDTFTYTLSDGDETATGTVTVRIDSLYLDWSQGTGGEDKLFGNNKDTNKLNGGAGDDMVKGGKVDDWLAGGTGNDKLLGLSGNDHLWGNAGDDELIGNGGYDTAYYFGLRSSYSIRTVDGTVQVVDNAPTIDGNDGTDTIAGIELLSFKNGETASVVSPIILDLSGDGIETLSASQSRAKFDLDGDGLADDTSWISADEAFLYLDRDGNGTMSGVEEISFIDDVEGATTDLGGLAAWDSNGDGKIDKDDERFGEFGVWRDADGDGAVDEGETASLAQVGIASIDLTGTAVNGSTEFGEVAVINKGSFKLTNGSTREFADAALTYFSASTNLPDLDTSSYGFDRKAKKYRLLVANGAIAVGPKKAQAGIDPNANQLGANTVLRFKDGTYGMFAPVVLDLDGDGIEMVHSDKSRAGFDYDGDGMRNQTGWLKGDDGFLVIDRNNDGLITEASELSLASERDDARSGLQGLAAMDSNNDGVIDADDARFGELRVWRDRNGNGITDQGELMTLEDAGLASIRLDAVSGNLEAIKLGDNALVATTSFVRSDGTTGTVADVSLAYRPDSKRGAGASALARPGDWTRPVVLQAGNALGNVGNDLLTMGDLFEMLRTDGGSATELFDRFDRNVARSAAGFDPALSVAMAPQSDAAFAGARKTLQADSIGLQTPAVAAPIGTTRPAGMLVNAMEAQAAAATLRAAEGAAGSTEAPAHLDWQQLDLQGGPAQVETAALDMTGAAEAQASESAASATAEGGSAEPATIERSNMVADDYAGGPEAVSAAMWADLGVAPVATGEAAVNEAEADAAETTDAEATGDSPAGKLASVEGAIMGGENATPGGADAELARKLMLIRQDLGSFGATGAGESDRLTDQTPDPMQLYG